MGSGGDAVPAKQETYDAAARGWAGGERRPAAEGPNGSLGRVWAPEPVRPFGVLDQDVCADRGRLRRRLQFGPDRAGTAAAGDAASLGGERTDTGQAGGSTNGGAKAPGRRVFEQRHHRTASAGPLPQSGEHALNAGDHTDGSWGERRPVGPTAGARGDELGPGRDCGVAAATANIRVPIAGGNRTNDDHRDEVGGVGAADDVSPRRIVRLRH